MFKFGSKGLAQYMLRIFLAVVAAFVPVVAACGAVPVDCFGTPYGASKVGADEFKPGQGFVSYSETGPSGTPAHIVLQERRLESPPEEIGRIKRGARISWTGAFINDGLSGFSGIDLDRGISVHVERRTRRNSAFYPRDILPPVFQTWDILTVGRKFTDGNLTEVELVSVRRLQDDEMEAFVCVANAFWSAPLPPGGPPPLRGTDSFSGDHGLYDWRQQASGIVRSRKLFPSGNAVGAMLSELAPRPTYDWPIFQAPVHRPVP